MFFYNLLKIFYVNRRKENSKCKKCITYEEDRFEFEQKYMKMEKQFKKCGKFFSEWIINHLMVIMMFLLQHSL
jgi:hypothetical protein